MLSIAGPGKKKHLYEYLFFKFVQIIFVKILIQTNGSRGQPN
jgi:hypothetical protein